MADDRKKLTVGSLFTGYGGLDEAVCSLLDAEPAWFVEFAEAPSKILAHHWPDVPNYGDVTKVDWDQVPPVDIITGGSPCFTGNVPVLTHRGLVPIRAVNVGDKVLTHKNRWREVTATMTRTSETVEFQPGMYATPDHKFYTRADGRKWDNTNRRYVRDLGEPEWTPISESHGKYLAIPMNIPPIADVPELPDGWTWWHVGRYVADGWLGKNDQPVIAIGKHKLDRDSAMFPESQWAHSVERTVVKVRYRTKFGVEFLGDFGTGAAQKTIPAWLLSADHDVREEFLNGYWSGDGSPTGKNSTKSVSVSPLLTAGIRLLAVSLGYTAWTSYTCVEPTTVIEGRTVNQKPWWQVVATPDTGHYTENDGTHMWFKLRKQPKDAGKQTVFDLTVDEDHSFIAGGIVAHNCQDLSLAGKRAGMTEGTRSNLWVNMREAIRRLHPRLVVWENVMGALSAHAFSELDTNNSKDNDSAASSDVEQGEGRLGGTPTGSLRAIGRVLGDLSEIGYDAEWTVLRASDIGGCHHRARVFLIAYPADSDVSALREYAAGALAEKARS